jgi:hypothetical protein
MDSKTIIAEESALKAEDSNNQFPDIPANLVSPRALQLE